MQPSFLTILLIWSLYSNYISDRAIWSKAGFFYGMFVFGCSSVVREQFICSACTVAAVLHTQLDISSFIWLTCALSVLLMREAVCARFPFVLAPASFSLQCTTTILNSYDAPLSADVQLYDVWPASCINGEEQIRLALRIKKKKNQKGKNNFAFGASALFYVEWFLLNWN